MITSNYHVEMNPSDVGANDRYVVQVRVQQQTEQRGQTTADGHSAYTPQQHTDGSTQSNKHADYSA